MGFHHFYHPIPMAIPPSPGTSSASMAPALRPPRAPSEMRSARPSARRRGRRPRARAGRPRGKRRRRRRKRGRNAKNGATWRSGQATDTVEYCRYIMLYIYIYIYLFIYLSVCAVGKIPLITDKYITINILQTLANGITYGLVMLAMGFWRSSPISLSQQKGELIP